MAFLTQNIPNFGAGFGVNPAFYLQRSSFHNKGNKRSFPYGFSEYVDHLNYLPGDVVDEGVHDQGLLTYATLHLILAYPGGQTGDHDLILGSDV